ncbi:MAG: hypothetical protein ACRC92_20600 [Peptostreptococcaceae bacterium]
MNKLTSNADTHRHIIQELNTYILDAMKHEHYDKIIIKLLESMSSRDNSEYIDKVLLSDVPYHTLFDGNYNSGIGELLFSANPKFHQIITLLSNYKHENFDVHKVKIINPTVLIVNLTNNITKIFNPTLINDIYKSNYTNKRCLLQLIDSIICVVSTLCSQSQILNSLGGYYSNFSKHLRSFVPNVSMLPSSNRIKDKLSDLIGDSLSEFDMVFNSTAFGLVPDNIQFYFYNISGLFLREDFYDIYSKPYSSLLYNKVYLKDMIQSYCDLIEYDSSEQDVYEMFDVGNMCYKTPYDLFNILSSYIKVDNEMMSIVHNVESETSLLPLEIRIDSIFDKIYHAQFEEYQMESISSLCKFPLSNISYSICRAFIDMMIKHGSIPVQVESDTLIDEKGNKLTGHFEDILIIELIEYGVDLPLYEAMYKVLDIGEISIMNEKMGFFKEKPEEEHTVINDEYILEYIREQRELTKVKERLGRDFGESKKEAFINFYHNAEEWYNNTHLLSLNYRVKNLRLLVRFCLLHLFKDVIKTFLHQMQLNDTECSSLYDYIDMYKGFVKLKYLSYKE